MYKIFELYFKYSEYEYVYKFLKSWRGWLEIKLNYNIYIYINMNINIILLN